LIDPHVHLRDWDQADQETVRHGLQVARWAGLDAVFEMPNTSPPLTSRATIERRIALADRVCGEIGITHGLYAGLTSSPDQVREVVEAHADLYPRVVGLKLFAGHSTGHMGIVDLEDQRSIYRQLARAGYRGVLAVHAEKESHLGTWDPARPSSHARARPPEAEVASVEDQVRLAEEEGFCGVLHIAHLSVPRTLGVMREARGRRIPFRITCGITPHHALLTAEDMDRPGGALLKVNPPLRPRCLQVQLLAALLDGEVDWIETDHAPHALEAKTTGHASGVPGLPFYPSFLRILLARGLHPSTLDDLTHGNVERVFGFSVPRRAHAGPRALSGEYPFDPFSGVHEDGSCPTA
jgi:dihydroorotase